mmetsp:Transcript_26785/g.53437  ORF Transcript_26785/g.53437 Transcript_26785/m.53437 type:complete len:124 (-) Transcript_26785:161-532(-)
MTSESYKQCSSLKDYFSKPKSSPQLVITTSEDTEITDNKTPSSGTKKKQNSISEIFFWQNKAVQGPKFAAALPTNTPCGKQSKNVTQIIIENSDDSKSNYIQPPHGKGRQLGSWPPPLVLPYL